jgi:hypothetical protein
MQTLNVGAGRTDSEYQEAAEQRRADLRSDSREDANYFFYAAGLALVSSGLLPLQIKFLINIGFFDLLSTYGGSLQQLHFLFVYSGVVVTSLAVLVGLGFAGRYGQRWAFWVGIVLYAADMIALMAMFSLWAFGVHAFFVFKWFQGQKALKDIKDESASAR